MSEKMLKVPVSDLVTVRVVCQKCQVVLELPLDQVQRHSFTVCPLCHASFDPAHTGNDAVADFARVIQRLQQLKKVVQVEFVLPEEP